jgi:transposase
MERKRRTFTPEFKSQAVQLARDLKSPTEAGRQLGVSESVIRVWMRKSDEVTAIQAQEPGFSIEEFRRIQKENEKLKKVNQILKSAAAFFSQDHLK